MDTITHGLAGSVLARGASRQTPGRVALLVGGVAAMWPDLDFLFFSDRLDYLRNHRSWSHSFVYLPIFGLVLALLAKLAFRRSSLLMLWGFCALGIASHILFDWITSFGTMFLVPFSRHRFTLDWVFILDPIFTGIVLVGLIAAIVFRRRAWTISLVSSGLLVAYILFCAVLHGRALETWRRLDRPPANASIAVLPQFLSPFRWLGLSEHDGEIHTAFFDIGPFAKGTGQPKPPERWSEVIQSLSDYYPPPSRAVIRRFPEPLESPALAAARTLPDAQIYLAFARFPLATVIREPGGGAAVTWEDLRFLPWFAGPWRTDRGRRLAREPFVYRIRLDAGGHPIERGFVPSLRPR